MKKVKVVILSLICISLVVGGYYYLTHSLGNRNVETEEELTELQKVLAKDLENSYPKTPREVVKFYNRIMTCLYNEEYTDEEFEKLAAQARALFDVDLLAENPEEVYLVSLKSEVDMYKTLKKTLVSTNVSDSAEVQFKTIKGSECAYVNASYFTRQGDADFSRSTEEYILRMDVNENWKILGFHLLGDNDSDE